MEALVRKADQLEHSLIRKTATRNHLKDLVLNGFTKNWFLDRAQ